MGGQYIDYTLLYIYRVGFSGPVDGFNDLQEILKY